MFLDLENFFVKIRVLFDDIPVLRDNLIRLSRFDSPNPNFLSMTKLSRKLFFSASCR